MGVPSMWVFEAQKNADEKRQMDLFANLHKVRAKTLCLGCEEDPVCTAHVSRVTAKGIEGAQTHIIAESGHFPWIEKPVEFFDVVIGFFKAG